MFIGENEQGHEVKCGSYSTAHRKEDTYEFKPNEVLVGIKVKRHNGNGFPCALQFLTVILPE